MKMLILASTAALSMLSTTGFAKQDVTAEIDDDIKANGVILSEIKSCQRPAILETSGLSKMSKKNLAKGSAVKLSDGVLWDKSIASSSYYFRLASNAGMPLKDFFGKETSVFDLEKFKGSIAKYEKTKILSTDIFQSDEELFGTQATAEVTFEMINKFKMGGDEYSDDSTGQTIKVQVTVNLLELKISLQKALEQTLSEIRKDNKKDGTDATETHMGDLTPLVVGSVLDSVPQFIAETAQQQFVETFKACK